MITEEQKKAIRELSESGRTVKEIAATLSVSERTVKRYNKKASVLTENGTSTEDISDQNDYTTDTFNLSSTKQDKLSGKYYSIVIYPTEEWLHENCPDCDYDGSSGWGTAPDDWIDRLVHTGLQFAVSALHDKDINPDGTKKKPHWHVIIAYPNTTTYRTIRVLVKYLQLNCPMPELLGSVVGMYRYFTHRDNPEKYQYTEKPKHYNGFQLPIEGAELLEMKREIRKLIYTENCVEYGELVSVCATMGDNYFDVVTNHTYFFDKLCSSFRHNPVVTLARVFNEFVDEPDTQKKVEDLMQRYVVEEENESDS